MLRITRETDYAVVLMTRLASERVPTVHAARDLSNESRIPLPMVSKILKSLAKGALLTSHRGVKGGYSLARGADQISIAEIIHLLEGPIAMTECVSTVTSDCEHESCCPVRGNWQKINTAVHETLSRISLREMASSHGLACSTSTMNV